MSSPPKLPHGRQPSTDTGSGSSRLFEEVASSKLQSSHSENKHSRKRSAVTEDSLEMPAQPASQVHVIRLLRNLVWYNLDNGILHSAIFAAERLLAQDSSNAESAHLLALCYFRNHQVKSAKAIASKFLRFLGCAYIYAQCCLMLGNGHEKSALNALEKCKAQWFGHASWGKGP